MRIKNNSTMMIIWLYNKNYRKVSSEIKVVIKTSDKK